MKKKLLLLSFALWLHAQNVVGVLEDANRSIPIDDADVCDKTHCVKSTQDGSFSIDTDAKRVYVVARGYRNYSFETNATKKIHLIQPFEVKGLYLTFWGANQHSKTFKKTMEMLQKTPLNAVVVDVKNEYGDILYKTALKKPDQYGAYENRQVYDIKDFISRFKKNGTYLIARIVLFKDERQASSNPDYAIYKDGKIWRNHDNMAWVDPFDKRSWKYTVDIAVDAAKKGFDEINFDYIRFPARSGLTLKKENTIQNRYKALDDFLAYAKKRLRPYGVFISVDIYGNICWSKDDMGIGQNIANYAKHADYIAPMLYPSSFASGTLKHKYPSEYPYEMVYKSLVHSQKQIHSKRLRPWIQAFKDYTKRRKHYGTFEIQEQIRAAEDANCSGWMLWSPSSKYKISYFQNSYEKKSEKSNN